MSEKRLPMHQKAYALPHHGKHVPAPSESRRIFPDTQAPFRKALARKKGKAQRRARKAQR